jgi:hypothetical protein
MHVGSAPALLLPVDDQAAVAFQAAGQDGRQIVEGAPEVASTPAIGRVTPKKRGKMRARQGPLLDHQIGEESLRLSRAKARCFPVPFYD